MGCQAIEHAAVALLLLFARVALHSRCSQNTDSIVSQHTKDTLSAAFAESLLSARGDRSQAEFARYLGIANQQTYQRYEQGLVPSGKVLHSIASKIGVTIDALLTTGTQTDAEAAGKKVLLAPGETPWGREMEEDRQMLAAISLLCRRMTSRQIMEAIQDVIKDRAFPEKSKVFWVKILGPWALTKLGLEDFEKLTPGQKVAARLSKNLMQQADPSSHKKTA